VAKLTNTEFEKDSGLKKSNIKIIFKAIRIISRKEKVKDWVWDTWTIRD
jgi:hypothetical protein